MSHMPWSCSIVVTYQSRNLKKKYKNKESLIITSYIFWTTTSIFHFHIPQISNSIILPGSCSTTVVPQECMYVVHVYNNKISRKTNLYNVICWLQLYTLYHHTIYNSFYSSSNTVSAKSSFLSLCRPEDEKFWGDSTGVTGRGGAEGIDSVTEP